MLKPLLLGTAQRGPVRFRLGLDAFSTKIDHKDSGQG